MARWLIEGARYEAMWEAGRFITTVCGSMTVQGCQASPEISLDSWQFSTINNKIFCAFLPQGLDNTGGWGNTTGVSLLKNDYPATLEVNQKAGSILIRDLQGHIPAGTYTLMYDEDGMVDCGAFDVAEIRWACHRWPQCCITSPRVERRMVHANVRRCRVREIETNITLLLRSPRTD